MATISESGRLLALGLLNFADDEGFFNANEKLIKAAIFPLIEPSKNIPELLAELSAINYVAIFDGSDNKRYGQVINFRKHQRVSKPSASKIKDLITLNDESQNASESLSETSDTPTVRLPVGKEQGTEYGKEQGTEYGKEQGTGVDATEVAALVWDKYSSAYHDRYKIDPVRNAKVNSQIKQLVKRLGVEAPNVAEYFITCKNDYYTRRGHQIDLLLADAEKLRTEWATGKSTEKKNTSSVLDRMEKRYG